VDLLWFDGLSRVGIIPLRLLRKVIIGAVGSALLFGFAVPALEAGEKPRHCLEVSIWQTLEDNGASDTAFEISASAQVVGRLTERSQVRY
jgi:hypothetical protein